MIVNYHYENQRICGVKLYTIICQLLYSILTSFYKMPHLTGLLLFVMLVLVRGDPAFTKTEVIGLDILAPRHPKLYSLIVGRLGYDINTNTNIVSNRQGNVDESCQPDATGRQICLKVCDFF